MTAVLTFHLNARTHAVELGGVAETVVVNALGHKACPSASAIHTAICGCMSVGKPGYGMVFTFERRSRWSASTRIASSYSVTFAPISRSFAVMQSRCFE